MQRLEHAQATAHAMQALLLQEGFAEQAELMDPTLRVLTQVLLRRPTSHLFTVCVLAQLEDTGAVLHIHRAQALAQLQELKVTGATQSLSAAVTLVAPQRWLQQIDEHAIAELLPPVESGW